MMWDSAESTSSVLYIANETPPSPVKLKTSNSVSSPWPSGTTVEEFIKTIFSNQEYNNENYIPTMGQRYWIQDIDHSCPYQVRGIPNTSFSFPAPLITVSVARYWSPNACLPMHIAFVQPGNVKIFRHLHSSRSN